MNSEPLRILDYDELPPLSELTCKRTADGVLISVPAEGFQRLFKRMCRMPRWWISLGIIMLANTWPLLIRMVRQLPNIPTLYSIGPQLGAVPAVAVGLLIGMWITGRRSAELRADQQGLRILSRGYFHSRKRAWKAENILEIGEMPTCIKLLVARPKGSILKRPRKIFLLPGRDGRELIWVARTLRDALAIPQHSIESPRDDE